MISCDGCGALRFERWPKGAAAAICTAPGKMQLTPGGARVVDYAAGGVLARVQRPAWCEGKEKRP